MSKITIVGAGLVGLATAIKITQQNPDHQITVIEKETTVGKHQSGTNSGVLHSGIYYKPETFRAKMCRVGKAELEAFCEEEAVPYEKCGKVIVAVSEDELPSLATIYERGQANGVDCRLVDKAELAEIEPHTAGIKAIHVPESGIVDYPLVAERMAQRLQKLGHTLRLGTRVTGIREHQDAVTVETDKGEVSSDLLITCAGLQSDRVATMATGASSDVQIVPFRGEYYELKPSANYLCRGLIYPVPDPRFPFLGVHFTKMIDGSVECGPNAVLAWAREGYLKRDVNLRDLSEAIRYPGFQSLARKYWLKGAGEVWRSFNKFAFVKALQRLVPDIRANQLVYTPAGVRAMALQSDGEMMDDFAFRDSRRTINVVNAPSPAATACLKIGELIANKLPERLG